MLFRSLMIGLAPAQAFYLALAGNLIWMSMGPILNGTTFAIVQSIVPPGLQGRVFSIMMSGAGISSLLGLSLAGPIVDRTGVQFWFVLTGGVVILISLAGWLISPVMHMEAGPRQVVPVQKEERVRVS